jgi:LDH2 family malate/lactate/ureidoglycolate dehydrogenase
VTDATAVVPGQHDTTAEVLLHWSDVVVTCGRRGGERVLIAAANLEVHAGEVVWIHAPDAATREALATVLDGTRRPLYGAAVGVARPAGAAVRLVLTDGSADVSATEVAPAVGGATVVIAAASDRTPASARVLSVVDGALRPVAPALSVHRWPVEVVGERVVARLVEVGTDAATARVVADVLVDANVRGHDSHGVQLVPMYLDRVRAGGIDPSATPHWITRGGVVNVLSASGGFGQIAAREAARVCATEAAERGLAAVAVRDNNHIGMLAAYRQPFVDAGVIALVLNISGPGVAAPGAARATLGNDAVCVIAPRGSGKPALIADFATGAVASGKIRDAAAHGRRLPDGWLIGPDGRPSTDPEDLDRGGAVPVFGGAATAHKGLCVAVLTEVLAGMLGGATVSPRVNKQRQSPELAMGCSQMFLGFSPEAFAAGDLDELAGALVDAVVGGYGAALPRIHFPEQMEQLRTVDNLEHGLDLPSDLALALGLTR